jgi:hypothetical protein
MVMELVEQPSRRNRSFKSGRVLTKRTRRTRSRRNGQPRRDLRNGKLMHRFWNMELGAETVPDSGACVQRAENSHTASRNIELRAEILPN